MVELIDEGSVESDEKVANICVTNQETMGVVPESSCNNEGINTRDNSEPERCDHSTGMPYAQMEIFHNIMIQTTDQKNTLNFREEKGKVVADNITHLKAQCNAQQFIPTHGLKDFLTVSAPAEKQELEEMYKSKFYV